MTREANPQRRDIEADRPRAASDTRPQPGWFLHESAPLRQSSVGFQPQLDAETVRNYWRSRAQHFAEPPEIDAWDDEEELHGPRSSPEAASTLDPPPAPVIAADARRGNGAFAAMVLAAGCIGIIGGVVALDQIRGGEVTASARALAAAWWRDTSPLAHAEVVIEPASLDATAAKSLLTATLDVKDVQGEASALIPLWLKAGPGAAGREIALRIEGLPEHARLTAGTRIGGVWLLRSEEIDDVRLMVPIAPKGPLALSVSAVEVETGALASPIKQISVLITPAVAPARPAQNFAAMRRNIGLLGAP